jgi:hypothetical protein
MKSDVSSSPSKHLPSFPAASGNKLLKTVKKSLSPLASAVEGTENALKKENLEN